MATDDLLDEGTEGTEKAKADSPAPLSAADIGSAVKDALSDSVGEMRNMTSEMTRQVQAVVSQAQQAAERGNANQAQSDLTQQLLTEPEKAITGIVQKLMANTLGPYLSTDIQDKYENLVDIQRRDIDSEYGDGTFDELIMPNLEAVIEQTQNASSKGSKQYIKTVVEGILGNKSVRPKLRERHLATVEAKKKAEIEAPSGVLDGGRRRPTKSTLSAEDIGWLAHLEDETGRKPDRKLLEDALNVRNRDGGWTSENFPGLTK